MDEKELRKLLESERAKEEDHRKRADLLESMLAQSETSEWPAKQIDRLNKGLCLECGSKLGSSETIRGNHVACFHRTYRKIQYKEITKHDAETKLGLLAPRKKSGRKRKTGSPPEKRDVQKAAEKKERYKTQRNK